MAKLQEKFDFDSDIVISGMSGRFPASENLEEFWTNLIEGKDMCTDTHERFNVEEFDMPTRLGALKQVDKFDAEFFSVHGKQSDVLDPRLRNLLEVSYEALIDAGVNPATIKGSNTGVFVAGSDSEAGFIWKRCNTKPNSYGVLGNALSMMSNRLSFTFGFTGPSYVVDTACSGSTVAFQQAVHSIRTGLCDAAIVAGVQTHHDPISSYMFYHLEMTSKDGKSKVFDASADGYVRAEAAVSLYICKKQHAKRSYCSIIHAATNNDGYKEQGITFPSEAQQEQVIRRVYDECGISPLQVDYIEAHGTGTKVGDPEEIAAVSKVFCEGRKGPLLVGSVKSNMGHPETVAGLCAISKVLLSNTKGIIPANLHYNTPNPDIPSLHDGRIQVCDKTQPFNAKYVGVSSMGFGGTNVHVLLKMTPREEQNIWTPPAPVIILCSGRTQEAVQLFLEKALEHHQNHHYVYLLHEVSKHEILKHPYRGFVVVEPEKREIQVEQRDTHRSNWYVFTGLGSQWAGMSKDLVKFDVFKNSVEKSAKILLEKNNFDIMSLLECGDTKKFEDFKNSVVSITTIQIALVDLLESIGIKPDGIIGHSTGEVAAAYADGCLTQEQAVLVSFARVRAVLESNLPPGTVASVGLTWEDAQKRCPPGIYTAIHNAKENVTIAGPPDVVKDFLQQLESEGIFAKPVRSAAFGFHSPLVEESGKLAKVLLTEIIPEPKPRSSIWLSSSVPEDRWDTDLAKFCSADYYVNNGVKPVYFYPTLKHVPDNAIIYEIAPHCFFQSILKQSLPKSVVKVGLIHCKSTDNCAFFLQAIGQVFLAGVTMDVGALYDRPSLPAPPPTPNISPLIRWDHSTTWDIPHHKNELSRQKGTKYSIHLLTDVDAFLDGHKIEEKIVFPATGYLHLIWKFFAHQQGTNSDKLPVVFEDVSFQRLTLVNKRNTTEFLLNIFSGTGKFEILESDMVVCSGTIRNIEGELSDETFIYNDGSDIDVTGPSITREDFYKEMDLRGYTYSGQFQGIKKIDMKGNWSQVEWPGHWISFMDSMLQTFSLRNKSRDLVVPTYVSKVSIDPIKVKEHLDNNENLITVKSYYELNTGTCPGIEMRGFRFVKFNQRPRHVKPTLMEHAFLPFIDTTRTFSYEHALASSVELILENSSAPKFVFTEILQCADSMICHMIIDQFMSYVTTQFELRVVNESDGILDDDNQGKGGSASISLNDAKLKPSNFIYVDDKRRFAEAVEMVVPSGFLLFSGPMQPSTGNSSLMLVSQKGYSKENVQSCFYLYRKCGPDVSTASVISLDNSNFEWVETSKKAVATLATVDRIVFVSKLPHSGITGFVKCLIKEVTSEKIRCFQTIDPTQLDFGNPSDELRNQTRQDLVFNIYKNKSWGFFSNLVITNEEYEERRMASHVFANATVMGDLSSLSWIESSLQVLTHDLIEVHYASLNFKDIMLAGGKLVQEMSHGSETSKECVLGMEFSGIYQGRRVCGLGISQCLATRIDPQNVVMFDIPQNWSLEEAATAPSVYATVYYALFNRGHLKEGESILIHAGSGGVGQAAIEVALSHKCTVYTTVSTPEKREFLKTRFPALTDDNITNSRDAKEFEGHIKKHTKGHGVDLVLNSLAQDKLLASLRCLGQNGRFLEIGKFDIISNTNIGLNVLAKGVAIHGILVDKLLSETNMAGELAELKKAVEGGMNSGRIKPIPATLFSPDQLEDAFRYMAQGKHIGKVVIKVKEDDSSKKLPALPRTYFDAKKSYIIVGGLGGMGFELANWMIVRQAKNIILVSRTAKTSTYHDLHIDNWKKQDVNVLLNQSDVSTMSGARILLHAAQKLGPIGGIFNTAVVLNDAPFEEQTTQTFLESAKAKADATMNLDTLSRQFAPELDHFVVFSSLVAAKGNASQTNYGYSNSVMERICEQRKSVGLPGLAIQWGVVGDVGVLNRQMREKKSFFGLAAQSLKSCLEILDLGLQQKRTVISSFVPINRGDMTKINPNESLVNIAATILGIKDVSKVNPKTKLVDLGMDSLMAAELAQVLQSRRNIQMSNKEYTQLTFERLEEMDKTEARGEGQEASKENQTELKKMLAIRKMSDKAVIKMKSLDKNPDKIFLVHPMDGTMMTLEALIEELDANVYGVECVREAPLESVEGLAAYYLRKIREIQPHGPYKLGGYSFGGNVAFEMTLMLEKLNEKVSLLLLLDGSPRWKFYSESYEEGKRTEWENMILIGYLKNYITDVPFTVYRDLSGMDNQADKVSYVARMLHDFYPDVPLDDIKDCASFFKKRVECGINYEPKGKVKARTVLLKALLGGLDKKIGDDYGLTEVCESEVEIIGIDDNHFCFYENPFELDLPAILNEVIG